MPTPDAPPMTLDELTEVVMRLMAIHEARIYVMEKQCDLLVDLQQHLVRSHAEHDVKMDTLMAIVHALKDLQRAKRN